MPDEPTIPTPAPAKRRRKPGSKNAAPITPPKPHKPKDPRILAVEADALAKKAGIRAEDASARQLRVIREKRLPKLTPAHRHELFLELSKTETPEFSFGNLGNPQAVPSAPTAAPLPAQPETQS